MTYIQVGQSVVTHRKTLRLARLLNMDRYAVVGRLVAFWSWSLDNAPKGCLADIEPDILADVLDYDGTPSELIEAMLTAGFLDRDEQGHWWIHGWDETMLPYVEGREKNAARMREARARERVERVERDTREAAAGGDVTPVKRALHVQRTSSARADVEERREEKSIPTVDTTDEDRPRVSMAPVASAALTLGALALASASPSPSVLPAAKNVVPLKPIPKPAAISPAIKTPRPPDLLWDACVAACGGVAPSNKVERGKWNKGLAALRESGATPEEIAIRATRYRHRYGERITLNPMALAGNWITLATEVTDSHENTTHGSAAQQQRSASGSGRSGGNRTGGARGGYTRPHLPDADEWERYRQKLEAEGRYGQPLRGVRSVQ